MTDQSAVAREIAGLEANPVTVVLRRWANITFLEVCEKLLAAEQATARAHRAGRHEGMVEAARIATGYEVSEWSPEDYDAGSRLTKESIIEAIRAAIPVSAQPEEG